MAFVKVRLSNTVAVEAGDDAVILGRSGFTTSVGVIPLLCTAVKYVPEDDEIALTLRGLNDVIDDNFNTHLFQTNTTGYASHAAFLVGENKGYEQVIIPISETPTVGSGFPGYLPDGLNKLSLNIVSHNLSNNTIRVRSSDPDFVNLGGLSTQLMTPPMFVELTQLVDTRYLANNSLFVSGLRETRVLEANVYTASTGKTAGSPGAYSLNLYAQVGDVSFLRGYVDGIQIPQSRLTLNPNASVTISGLVDGDYKVRIEHDHYTVPVIERGDNLSIQYGNVLAITNTSFDSSSPTYNAIATANQIFKVQFLHELLSNVGGQIAINTSRDIQGNIASVDNGVANVTYNAFFFPGLLNLAKYNVYSLITNSRFSPIQINGQQKRIENVPAGVHSVKAVAINPYGYTSRPVTKSIEIRPIPIQKISDLEITETLYLDKNKGVLSRATVVFTHILGQQITDYEISYKISGGGQFQINSGDSLATSETFETFSTVKVSASGVTADGKIVYHINQLGSKAIEGGVSLTVRVTAMNGSISGMPTERTIPLVGKLAPPQNVTNFSIGQNENSIVMIWSIPRDSLGVPIDLDIATVEVRRRPGTYNVIDFDSIYENAEEVALTPAEQSTTTVPVTSFATYTYLVKTIDTSGNKSATTRGYVFTATPSNSIRPYKTYSEDNPSTPVISGIVNDNASEDDWISMSGSAANSSNASVNGFSEVAPDISFSDIEASTDDATYYTKIRDIGSIQTARIVVDWSGDVELGNDYNKLKNNLTSEVSDAVANLATIPRTHTSNVLIDTTSNGGLGIGSVLQNVFGANTNNFAYDPYVNHTLTNTAITSSIVAKTHTGKVLAVWIPGAFAGDGANANAFALIAGVINANAIALGQAFYANGRAILDSTGRYAWQAGANTKLTNSLPNVSSTSYQIVDFQQYNDDAGSIRFLGGADIASVNTIIRTSLVNAFSGMTTAAVANGIANTNVFVGANTALAVAANGWNALQTDGFAKQTSTERKFRYFQVGFNVKNSDPSTGKFVLDQLRYQVYLAIKKVQNTSIEFTSAPTTIQYAGYLDSPFTQTPHVTVMPINTSVPLLAIPVVTNNSNCSINLYYAANGLTANTSAGFTFSLTAEGI